MAKNNLVIIDTETGGLSPREHSLLTIGMVFVKDGEIRHKKEWFVKHDVYNVSAKAMEINGINLVEHDRKAQPIEDIRKEFHRIMEEIYPISKPSVVGHNISFDIGFVHEQFMEKRIFEGYVTHRNIDTAGIARFLIDAGIIKMTKADLTSLIKYYLDGSPSEDRHTALYDAEKTYEIYKRMMAELS